MVVYAAPAMVVLELSGVTAIAVPTLTLGLAKVPV